MSTFSLKCPFHVFVVGATASATLIWTCWHLFGGRKAIKRYDVDARFTDAASYNGLVFISGQVGDGKNIEEQTASALKYVDDALAKAGTDKSRILEATVWLSDIKTHYSGMNKVYDTWIVAGKPPCRACLEAKLAAPEYLVEIRVIAAL